MKSIVGRDYLRNRFTTLTGSIPMFEDFHLRKPAELDAVKLYLAFAGRRDTGQNVTRMTYNRISDYAGIKLGRIKRALGILNINGLITVESYERDGRAARRVSWVSTGAPPPDVTCRNYGTRDTWACR